MSLEEIASMSLGLSQEERAWLASRLLDSLDGPRATAADSEWAAELSRRVREADEGRCELVPAAIVHQEIAARLKR